MLDKTDFANPEKLPLDQLIYHVKKDIELRIPALSDHWIEKRCYTKYRGLTITEGKIVDDATLEEWINEAEYFAKDMLFLLSLNHSKFWSTVVFDKQSLESVVSFLQEATPFYLHIPSLTNNQHVITIYQAILTYVLRVICRLITNKESEEHWLTNEHHSELLYSKFLMSIPMLYDLIIAYGHSNLPILTKIAETIFQIETKYNDDLKLSLKYYQSTLKTIQEQVENDNTVNSISKQDDLTLYMLDLATTLEILLKIYNNARSFCNELHMEPSITNFYDSTIPLLYKNICKVNPESQSLEYINCARISFLKIFKSLISIHVEKVLEKPSESIIPAESYVAILTECLSDRSFVVDYQRYFPIESDIEILKQACKELDNFKCDFVLNAYQTESVPQHFDLTNGDKQSPKLSVESTSEEIPAELLNDIETITLQSERNIEKEVIAVRDILPHLGDGFIRRMLVRYDNPESVVTAILEGNLPPDLATVNQSEPYIPPDEQDTSLMQTGVVHNNIFDGDQYDVMTNTQPKCVIKSGKGFPGQPKNITEMLNDKSHVKEMKNLYQEYNLITEDTEYDDEYDDTYDAMAESESKSKPITRARLNNIVDEIIGDDDDDDNYESSSDESNARDTSKDTCENPEIIRARYEANRAAKMANRGGRKYKQESSSHELSGNPKGQGQDKKTVIERHKKDVNKSNRANHNRKSGASWKRNRGMIPM